MESWFEESQKNLEKPNQSNSAMRNIRVAACVLLAFSACCSAVPQLRVDSPQPGTIILNDGLLRVRGVVDWTGGAGGVPPPPHCVCIVLQHHTVGCSPHPGRGGAPCLT